MRMQAGNAYCDVVLCSSTAGSFLDGRLADGERAARLSRETGCRVITSAQCMLAALTALDVRRVTLITPSSRELNEVECAFLNDAGIDVVSQGGFYLKSPREILCTSPEEVAALVRQADRSQSEGVLISCSGLHVMELIPRLEEELGETGPGQQSIRPVGMPADPAPANGDIGSGQTVSSRDKIRRRYI